MAEHPRARGENSVRAFFSCFWLGTSPRTRGKRPCEGARPQGEGNIPAHAGKTNRSAWRRTTCDGTSPRTRGKLPLRANSTYDQRNIPAHAGKTHPCGHKHSHAAEHPRARGENPFIKSISRIMRGTSPRTRGKQAYPTSGDQQFRNIPAHAGKTLIENAMAVFNKEHPRARGENTRINTFELAPGGTSPRTRGKHKMPFVLGWRMGNIPAHAGKTQQTYGNNLPQTEHPRARGENVLPSRTWF